MTTQYVNSETQYFFDLSNKQWWVLPVSSDEWKELTLDEAHNLGLFNAVYSQECNFIDTDLSEYDNAVSGLIKDLDTKLVSDKPKHEEIISTPRNHFSTKILTRDFSKVNDEVEVNDFNKEENKKVDTIQEQNKNLNEDVEPQETSQNNISKASSKTEVTDQKEGPTNIMNQINNLIASTSQMKEICKARELSSQPKHETPNLRSTARHLTYVNNGGLAGCIKTVAAEREKMGKSNKKVSASQNSQLQEMIQRAKAMAAKTMDEVKEPEVTLSSKKPPQTKKSQLRSSKKKYTTVFGASALKDLKMNQQLPDVKFEVSSEEDSEEEESKNNNKNSSKDRNTGQKLGRLPTLGR